MFDIPFLERTSASYVPIFGHVRDGVLLLDDGSVYAMLEVSGLPWETADIRDIAGRHRRLNHTLTNIAADSVILSVYQCRGNSSPSIYPGGIFRSAFAADLDRQYRRALFELRLYDNLTFIGIQIRPERYAGEFVGEQISATRKPIEEADEERIQRLEDVTALLFSELRIYQPRRIGVRLHSHAVYSEIAETIVLAITGIWRPIPLTTGRLGESMFSEQIIIDREFVKYLLPGSIQYGAMFGMRHFPAWTRPGMFGKLLSASYRCTVFQSYRFISAAVAQDIMRRKRYRMLAAGDPAEDQTEALRRAANGISNADWVFGDYAFSLLAFADTEKALDAVATEAWANLADSGTLVAREMLALEAALFSMVPGNARLRPRPGYISSVNFAAMAPLHAYPAGEERGYWGGPVALFRTLGGTPYRFHLHVGDVGNTFICGRTGSGKSTMIAFLIAQAERAGATVVAWDKDRGLKVLVHALGGTYLELRNPTGLAPLRALRNSAEDIGFLSSLIRGCIMADGGDKLSPEEDRRLNLALHTIMAMPPEYRSMADVRAFLGVGAEGAGARLEKWCAGKEFGWVIDNERDLISLDAPVLGFDQTFVLDNPMARGPVMATLYHYVDKLIDGRRLLFVVDEFWKSLLDEAFRGLVNDKLRTLRKRNSPMILATQSPRDALVSAISHTIRDQCPSQFYFSNSHATIEDFGEAGMGLTDKEFEVVRNLPPGTGEFLLKQGGHSVVAQLPLDGLDDMIAVLSGREATTLVWDRVQNLDAFQRERKKETVE